MLRGWSFTKLPFAAMMLELLTSFPFSESPFDVSPPVVRAASDIVWLMDVWVDGWMNDDLFLGCLLNFSRALIRDLLLQKNTHA